VTSEISSQKHQKKNQKQNKGRKKEGNPLPTTYRGLKSRTNKKKGAGVWGTSTTGLKSTIRRVSETKSFISIGERCTGETKEVSIWNFSTSAQTKKLGVNVIEYARSLGRGKVLSLSKWGGNSVEQKEVLGGKKEREITWSGGGCTAPRKGGGEPEELEGKAGGVFSQEKTATEESNDESGN